MSATDDLAGKAIVIADNPGLSGEKEDTQNDELVARMTQEMESLREEVQHIRELTYLVVMTLLQPPHFPSLDSIPHHFPSVTRQTTSTPKTVVTNPQSKLRH